MGNCVKCGTEKDGLTTNVGTMCRACFHRTLNGEIPHAGPVYTMPEPGQRGFVVREKPGSFITVDGTLYLFYRREDAESLVEGLKMGYALFGAFTEEVDAQEPWAYVMAHPELRLIGVKEKVQSSGSPGPHEIPSPKL
jgi:hypothetical protein